MSTYNSDITSLLRRIKTKTIFDDTGNRPGGDIGDEHAQIMEHFEHPNDRNVVIYKLVIYNNCYEFSYFGVTANKFNVKIPQKLIIQTTNENIKKIGNRRIFQFHYFDAKFCP